MAKKKKSSAYWKKRFSDLENAQNQYAQNTFHQIEPAFDKAQRQIQAQIEAWYGRYAANNGITMAEARKQLSAAELKELKWDVKEYIQYGQENALNQQWMKELENASAKFHISRLEALKIRTQQALEVAFGNELDSLDSMVKALYQSGYYHTCFEIQKGFNLGWEIGQIDERRLEKVVSRPWASDGMNFSDRVWKSKTTMVNDLHQELTRTIIQGKSPDEAIRHMTKYLQDKGKNAKYQAGRLVMTEQAFISSAAQKDAFTDLDVEEFEIVATLDSRTSEICQEMDGQHFPMKDFQPGVTAPPFHVWCRSTTVPYFDDEWSGGERAARGEDGKTYYVPSDMTYPEWKESLVDGQTDDLQEINSDGTMKDKPKTLSEKIQEIKDDIASNGGVMTEDHIKAAGKAVQDELVASRAGFKKEWEDAKAAYDSSDIKKQIDELDAKRNELHKKYTDAPYGSDERKQFYNEWENAKSEYWKVYSSDEAISFRSRVSDAKKKYEGTWKTNADELSAKLSEFREVGIGSHDLKKEHYSGRGTLRDIVTEAYSHYPSEWVEASIKKGHLKISKVSRGFYDGRTIAIDGWSEESQISTAFHELGHRFEDVVKGIYEAEDVFYKRRTAGCPLEWLGTGYSKSEKTRKDNFLHSYMGKEYPDNFYELVSMGFDYAYTDPTRLWADEDFAQFIYGILSLK